MTRNQAYGVQSLITDGKKDTIAGIDVDPKDDCKVTTDEAGNMDVKIYDKPASRLDMIDFMEERYDRYTRGKSLDSKKYFTGVDFDEQGNIVRK